MPLDAGPGITGKNFAPVKPLKNAKQAFQGESYSQMSDIMREICSQIEMEDVDAWRMHFATGQVNATLMAGKRILKRDLSGEGYVALRPAPSHNLQDRSNYPIFPQIMEDLKAKWLRIKPRMSARAYGDGYKVDIELKTLEQMVDAKFRDIFTKEYEINEALSALLWGTYITRFWYDEDFNQMTSLLPILKDQSKVLFDGYGGCLECPYEGTPDDFSKSGGAMASGMPQCPDCGSYNTTKMVDPQVVNEKVVSDLQPIVQGDIRGGLCNFLACKYDLRVPAHESSYFRYEQFMPIRLARKLFGEQNFDAYTGTGWFGEDFGLEIMEALAARGGNTESTGVDQYSFSQAELNLRVVHREYCLKPERYAGFKLSQDEETLSGRIPKGKPFDELFPDGIRVSGFNNMALITGFYPEKARIASGMYYVMPHSGVGKGLSDGVDIAKDISEMHSMAMADVKAHAASGVVVDKALGLSRAEVKRMFTPQGVTFANSKKAGFGNINEGITKLQFDSINPALPATIVQLANLLNLVSLSGDFSEGTLQQVDINTLGGQRLATAKEEGKKGAIIGMKSSHREQSAVHVGELSRQHMKSARYFPASNDKYGSTKGKWIAGTDLPEHIGFDADQDSAIPMTRYEKQESFKEMVRDCGGFLPFAQLLQADPTLGSFICDQYGIEMPQLSQEDIIVVCLERLDEIKNLSELFMDPGEVLSNLQKPVFQDEANHLLKAQFLGSVLDDDEVATWNPIARGAVQLLIRTHKDLQMAVQLEDGMRQQNAQAGLMAQGAQMSQQIMAPQQAAEQDQADQQNMMAAGADVAGRVMDDHQAQADHERQLEQGKAAHTQQMQRDKAQGDRALELERLKQKGASAKEPKK